MKEKLWCECSRKERDAFNRCDKKWKEAKKRYEEGRLSKEGFLLINELCIIWLDYIERKYRDK